MDIAAGGWGACFGTRQGANPGGSPIVSQMAAPGCIITAVAAFVSP